MAKINAEMNVKTSSGYDQLHLTSDASLTNYINDGNTSLTNVKSALDYIIDGKYKTLTSQDVLSYFVSTQKDNTSIVVRGINNPSPPTGQSTSSNDLYYISFRQSSTYISVVAFDSRANNIYSNVRNDGTWTGWNNIRNAKTLDGLDSTAFSRKSSVYNITVNASSWTGSSAPFNNVITVAGVTSNNIVEVSLLNTANSAQIKAWQSANVATATQNTNRITLMAQGAKPNMDIPVTVIVRGDS